MLLIASPNLAITYLHILAVNDLTYIHSTYIIYAVNIVTGIRFIPTHHISVSIPRLPLPLSVRV